MDIYNKGNGKPLKLNVKGERSEKHRWHWEKEQASKLTHWLQQRTAQRLILFFQQILKIPEIYVEANVI